VLRRNDLARPASAASAAPWNLERTAGVPLSGRRRASRSGPLVGASANGYCCAVPALRPIPFLSSSMNRAPLPALALALLLAATAVPAAAQSPQTPAVPAARPADVQSLDGILAALYEVISGPAGQTRDWDRMRSLFAPGARLIPTGPAPEGGHRHRMLSVEDYIAQVGPNLERMGFREHEIARRVEEWGHIAHVFSTYAGTTEAAPDRQMRGINSIQLMHDGARWWIMNVFWEAESADNPLPAKYLESGGRE
jgi:hypothetical protein